VEILPLTSFHGKNPMDETVLPGVNRDYSISRLLLLSSDDKTKTITGFTSNTYLVLKPVIVSRYQDWTLFPGGPFNVEQMIYVNEKLINIEIKSIEEKREAENKRIQSLTLTPEILINNGDHASIQSSRSSSSIRMTRIDLIENMDENKIVWVEQWINDCK